MTYSQFIKKQMRKLASMQFISPINIQTLKIKGTAWSF